RGGREDASRLLGGPAGAEGVDRGEQPQPVDEEEEERRERVEAQMDGEPRQAHREDEVLRLAAAAQKPQEGGEEGDGAGRGAAAVDEGVSPKGGAARPEREKGKGRGEDSGQHERWARLKPRGPRRSAAGWGWFEAGDITERVFTADSVRKASRSPDATDVRPLQVIAA